MPALNWDTFANLPGSAEKNFELLCRGIVRQNFGGYGQFRALANQPGVEFHLKLDSHSEALGKSQRWWGWQCKWYDLNANGTLGSARKAKIVDGIQKSEQYVQGLTDWVLWTRRTLAREDQEWFGELSSKMTLHLWTAEEVDNLLSGPASILRNTYFGEWVTTPEVLQQLHERSIAPIRTRWQPEVNHAGKAEKALRRILGESHSWEVLRQLATDLRAEAKSTESAPSVPEPLSQLVTDVVATSRQSADILDRIANGILSGDLDLLHDELRSHPRTIPSIVATAPRRLRSGNHRAGLYATNAVAGCRDTVRLIADVERAFSSRIVFIVAPAGCGKTHLAAQITASTDGRPNGLLLHGRDLHANHNLDDLARGVSISASPVPSMEALLAAIDAAGQRARHRLPVLIDGLNESEDPRAWKPLLAALETTLAQYPYVLLVCTLRPEFVSDAVPEGTRCIEIEGYGSETEEAIRSHFEFWKIDPGDATVPVWFLGHPLSLRLFCEVTNPKRQRGVGADAMPGSLTAIFNTFLEQVGKRVVQLAPRTHRYFEHDVRTALAAIGQALWHSRSRSIDFDDLRNLLDDAQRPWDQSLVRALEHEGVLLRMPSNGNGAYVPAYDRLGGHLISNALIADHGRIDFEQWLKEPPTTDALAGDYDVRHPLADDIVASLVGLVPRRFQSNQLWQLSEEPLRRRALRAAVRLEPTFLDAATVDALLALVREGETALFTQLWSLRASVASPFNALSLDGALRSLTVADRDLRWTEWLRKNYKELLFDLDHMEAHWRLGRVRAGDMLRSRWLMWTLTSTVRRLRDQATIALYWFGRRNPAGLFELAIESLSVNDPYIGERMLAATYGVAMAHQQADADFETILRRFLEPLSTALVGESATVPTFHYLTRLYARGIVEFSAKFYPAAVPASLRKSWSFGSPPPLQSSAAEALDVAEVRQTLDMDFGNYTLGRLFDDRRNYDDGHVGHQLAVAHVLNTVAGLGWRVSTFETLERAIAEDGYRYAGRIDRPHTERYGKKYGWIGFFTYAGILDDRKQLNWGVGSFSDVDIDPSFPERPSRDQETSVADAWLAPTTDSHEQWIREGQTTVPISILRRETIAGEFGPWIAVHGFLMAEDRILGRQAWAFISALVTDKKSASQLPTVLKAVRRPRIARDVPSDNYLFAGEIPWHPAFGATALAESAYSETIRIHDREIQVEVLSHEYAWESYHSETNHAGNARVPSQPLASFFDLRSIPQVFDQYLADGTRATVTLSGVDGLSGDVLYVREDLLRTFVGDRAIVWHSFGERELRPYPPSPPEWLASIQRERRNEWTKVFTEKDMRYEILASPPKRRRKKT